MLHRRQGGVKLGAGDHRYIVIGVNPGSRQSLYSLHTLALAELIGFSNGASGRVAISANDLLSP